MADDRGIDIFEDDDFRVFHCADVDVPGYLILSVRGEPRGWSGLSARQQARLGGLIARTVEALRAAAGPEKVYVCAFGEETPSLHFHLFPRYAWMADALGGRGGGDPLDGPALLSLIRRERTCRPGAWSDASGVRDIMDGLRRRLAGGAEESFEAEGDGS